jgi:RNA-directed DNA polymerase
LTARRRLRLAVGQVVGEVNRFLRAWAQYYRFGNYSTAFVKVSRHAFARVAKFVANRHSQPWSYGFWVMYRSPTALGLISLDGSVVPPRRTGPGG